MESQLRRHASLDQGSGVGGRRSGGALLSHERHEHKTMSPRQSTQGCGAAQHPGATGRPTGQGCEDGTVSPQPSCMRTFGVQGWLSPHAGTLRGGVGGGGPPLTLSAAFALRILSVYSEAEAHCNAMKSLIFILHNSYFIIGSCAAFAL
jgi:hypothetical protein